MFGLSDIRRLLDAFEQSDWDEVHVAADGIEVYVSAREVAHAPAPAAAAAAVPAPAHAPAAAGAPAAPAVPVTAQVAGAHAVTAPSPGIFWRAPAPGEPPFVEVGQVVSADTPIGIVEVMKLMNQVLAGVPGTVQAVLVENGARVDRGEPMILIEPGA